jgi:hypothetical protein
VYVCGVSVCVLCECVYVCVYCFMYVGVYEGGLCMCVVCQFVWCVSLRVCVCVLVYVCTSV